MNGTRQTALEKLKKFNISAKDISNQFWCEKQMELFYTTGQQMTAQMVKGSKVHEDLQVEVYVPLKIEPLSYADRLYKTAYENNNTINTLLKEKMARELKVYDSINGYRLSGQIDELEIKEDKVVIVENKTTNPNRDLNPEYTLPHIVQITLYRKVLEDLRNGSYSYESFSAANKLKELRLSDQFRAGLKEMNLKDEYLEIDGLYKKMFSMLRSLPELSDSLEIRYIDRQTGMRTKEMTVKYDKQLLEERLIYAMGYWRGEREAQPVPEKERWKCNSCRFFGKECIVWYKKGSNA